MRRVLRVFKRVLLALVSGLVGGFVLALVLFVRQLDARPDLSIWHTVDLPGEFEADSDVRSLADYLALEDALFAELDARVVSQVPTDPSFGVNRFSRGSLTDPSAWPTDWNRSFELRPDAPRAGLLLLHGMSDAPYSLRALALRARRAGAQVLGLRMPGHGTAPAALVHTRWEDMTAAVRLGVAHLAESVGDAPVFVVGYSNGAALAVHYALAVLDDPELPKVDGLVLISPAVGVTPLAAFAVWQARLGTFLGLDKLAWQSISPELEPFKYGSFPVNAGDLVFRITSEIQRCIQSHLFDGRLAELPPILAFQSTVDATVSTPALVDQLFSKLPRGGHRLVLFDVNRTALIERYLRRDPQPTLRPLLDSPTRDFTLVLLTNQGPESRRVLERRWLPGEEPRDRRLTLEWPADVFSLSHVALPFRRDDPVYGAVTKPGAPPALQLGSIALRGERGVLRVSGNDQLRLHWNPFYDYLEDEALRFTGLTGRR